MHAVLDEPLFPHVCAQTRTYDCLTSAATATVMNTISALERIWAGAHIHTFEEWWMCVCVCANETESTQMQNKHEKKV